MDNLRIGQVQWHSSEEDGGPDVGVLLRLDERHHLWAGELTNGDFPEPTGIKLWKDGQEVIVLPCGYDIARELVEDHLGPIIAAAEARSPTPENGLREALERGGLDAEQADRLRSTLNRRISDRDYMIAALVQMLGPTGLKVWEQWQAKGVQRIHTSWWPNAADKTGEERAALHLAFEEAAKDAVLIDNIDEHISSLSQAPR